MPVYKKLPDTDKPITQLMMFEYICEEINYEEERLQLWMLLSQNEKLDMLMHQLVEGEAQIMAFLVELEYGAEVFIDATTVSMPLDEMMDKAVENQIFMKYLKYATL